MNSPQNANRAAPTPASTSSGRIRRNGLIRVVCCVVIIGLYWPLGLMGLVEKVSAGGVESTLTKALLFLMRVPVVMFFAGLWEAVSGRPFRVLTIAWASFGPWMQGLLSFAVLLLAILLILVLLRLLFGVELLF